MPALDIRTLGQGQSDTCVFPFSYDTARDSHSPLSAVTYTQCVSDNLVSTSLSDSLVSSSLIDSLVSP